MLSRATFGVSRTNFALSPAIRERSLAISALTFNIFVTNLTICGVFGSFRQLFQAIAGPHSTMGSQVITKLLQKRIVSKVPVLEPGVPADLSNLASSVYPRRISPVISGRTRIWMIRQDGIS